MSREGFHIRAFRGQAGLDALEDEWDRILETSATNTPFQTFGYQYSWWKNLGTGDLLTLALYDQENPMAVAPFTIFGETLRLNGGTEETDYLDLIADPSHNAVAWDLILDHLENQEGLTWNSLEVLNLPSDSPSRAVLKHLAQTRGQHFEENIIDVCPVIELAETFESYLAGLNKKQRHEVRRKLRKAKAAGAEPEFIESISSESLAMEDFFLLLRRSSPEKSSWLNRERESHFRDVARFMAERGQLQLMFLRIYDSRVAVLFNLVQGDRVYVYNSGLDLESYGHVSPGVVLTAYAIEHAIKSGFSFFDFLRGNEAYKYRFGASDTTILSVTLNRSE